LLADCSPFLRRLVLACSEWHGESRAVADFMSIGPTDPYYGIGRGDVLVFPAASRPSISRRISLLPKILAIEREMAAPMVISRLLLLCGCCVFLGGDRMR
jgi:hypothetical protein